MYDRSSAHYEAQHYAPHGKAFGTTELKSQARTHKQNKDDSARIENA